MEGAVNFVGKAISRLLFLAWLLVLFWLLWSAITQRTITPAYPEEISFDSWLKTSWEHTTIYNGKAPTLYFYMDNESWNTGKEEWQKGALRRLGCAAVLEFPEDSLMPPYNTELYVSAPLPGGSPSLFSTNVISDEKTCTDDEKSSITTTTQTD